MMFGILETTHTSTIAQEMGANKVYPNFSGRCVINIPWHFLSSKPYKKGEKRVLKLIFGPTSGNLLCNI